MLSNEILQFPFLKKVSSLASPSHVAVDLGGEVWALQPISLWPPPPALGGEMRNSGEVDVSPLKTSGAHTYLK